MRRTPTSEVLLVRSNHRALVRLILESRVVESGDIHDLLASLLQQHSLLRITPFPFSNLVGSLIIGTGHPSKPRRSNLGVVESPVPSCILNPSISAYLLMDTISDPTELVVQILVVHVSMLILTLECTQFDLAHGTHLLHDASKASLLKTQSDTLDYHSANVIRYVKDTVSEPSRLCSHTHSNRRNLATRAIVEWGPLSLNEPMYCAQFLLIQKQCPNK